MIITITMSRKRGRKDNAGGLDDLHKGAITDLLEENNNLEGEVNELKEEVMKLKDAHQNEIRNLKGQVNTLITEVKEKEEQRLGEFSAFTAEINKLSNEKKKLRKDAVFEHEQRVNVYKKLVTVATCALRSGEMIKELANQQPGLQPAFADAMKAVEKMREERMLAVPVPQTKT